jgi:hypothetical protein
MRKVAATTVRPLAHGESRSSELVVDREGICVLTSGSFVERVSSPTILTAVRHGGVARIG